MDESLTSIIYDSIPVLIGVVLAFTANTLWNMWWYSHQQKKRDEREIESFSLKLEADLYHKLILLIDIEKMFYLYTLSMSQNSPVVLWSNIPDLRKSFNIPLSFIIKEKDLSKELYEFEQRMVYFNDTVQKEKETLDDIKQQSLKDSEAGKSNESTFYNLKQEEGRIDRCMFFVKDYIKEIMGYYYIVSVQFNKKSEEECKKELQKALGRRKNKQPVRHKFS